MCLLSSADHSSLSVHPSLRVYSPYVMCRVACGVWRVRVPPPSVSVEDAADGRCALPCLFSLKHVQFSRARPHTRDAKCDECRGKVVSRASRRRSRLAHEQILREPGTATRYRALGAVRIHSKRIYIYNESALVGRAKWSASREALKCQDGEMPRTPTSPMHAPCWAVAHVARPPLRRKAGARCRAHRARRAHHGRPAPWRAAS